MPTVKRPRFLPWALAFGVARAGDIWSTGLFMLQPGGEQGEMNPLTSIFGLSYWPLITINVLVSAIVVYGHWHYCRHFGERSISGSPRGPMEYQSLLFFGRPDRTWQLLFTVQRNNTTFHAQHAHILLKAITCVSVLAVLHNCGQVYDWPVNDFLRQVLIRPSLVYYGLMVPLAYWTYWRMAEREFQYQILRSSDIPPQRR